MRRVSNKRGGKKVEGTSLPATKDDRMSISDVLGIKRSIFLYFTQIYRLWSLFSDRVWRTFGNFLHSMESSVFESLLMRVWASVSSHFFPCSKRREEKRKNRNSSMWCVFGFPYVFRASIVYQKSWLMIGFTIRERDVCTQKCHHQVFRVHFSLSQTVNLLLPCEVRREGEGISQASQIGIRILWITQDADSCRETNNVKRWRSKERKHSQIVVSVTCLEEVSLSSQSSTSIRFV